MGANIANEVADDKFCETTIGESPIITYTRGAPCYTPSTLPSPPVRPLLPINQAKEGDPSIRGEGGLGPPPNQGKGYRSCLGQVWEESRISS